MEVGGGSKGAHAEPSAVAIVLVEDVSNNELSTSTASARSLDDVHTMDAEVVRQKREKKAAKVAQREERKKKNASLKRKHEQKSKESKFVKLVRKEG
jgi:uncharacterized spore protein YtfJ